MRIALHAAVRYEGTVDRLRWVGVENFRVYLATLYSGRILQVRFSTETIRTIMYAVVDIAGQQFVVAPQQKLTVNRLDKNVGETVEFTNITLTSVNGTVTVGQPLVKGTVKATVTGHGKGDKVLVFHKKRRKGYQKLNGHRQQFTTITITDINV